MKLSTKQIIPVGLMLFALFFGAGNMIFPPFLAQQAGSSVWPAILGFLITGVGLPLLGVIAISKAENLERLSSRVHPIYAVVFTVALYLVIGPLFAIPRTGTVAFEIGVVPFLPKSASASGLALVIFTVIYFAITLWLSLNPTKLVDRIGKILTPALLIVLAIFAIKSFITPLGDFKSPNEAYANGPFFKGFLEGYLTMDAIASLVFGSFVVASIKDFGIADKKTITSLCIRAGIIAAAALALVYMALAWIGATSTDAIGTQENGAAILSATANQLFGSFGAVILALAIFFACLTTAVGLITSCSQYFSKLIPKVSYKRFVVIFSVFSAVIANVGLSQLISFSVPVLVFIYPLAIVLIFLSFAHNLFKGYSAVYICAIIPTGLIGLVDGLNAAGVNVSGLKNALDVLPFFDQGVGWLVPAIAGALIGYVIALIIKESPKTINSH
ncbi:branched-chain amino acid transport system II carrier protein [Bacillus sp. S/N-304-OC-R1]|uniref:branched-chain amino acid transport system II carrier protein n=1 Tax=Bacillus sp. S/N-304-OC-R1 TaxID=2758034 RepID=UPI001C8D0FAA|nr:branched-chain amino acid transport system II carrier protein [Bacillus sp. S/N-304-OC-R1]MBY0124104.1 branched-chain amino acid transport system II carrier protein [Bacillus sp. S/N-304-OC-R1]